MHKRTYTPMQTRKFAKHMRTFPTKVESLLYNALSKGIYILDSLKAIPPA